MIFSNQINIKSLDFLYSESRCPKLDLPDHLTVSTTEVLVDTKVTLTCEEGFKLPNNMSAVVIVCQDNKEWNDTLPLCDGKLSFFKFGQFMSERYWVG